jgi:hypothetical protein
MKQFGRTRLVAVIVAACIASMLVLPAMSMAAIHVTKTASPTALTAGPGTVTYTYSVTNDDDGAAVDSVVLSDDKLGTVAGPASGNTNGNDNLEYGETWIYTKTTTLSVTTTNIATASGRIVEGAQTSDTASATVTVTSPSVPATRTITGGDIPETGSPWYNILVLGGILTLAGVMGVVVAARKSHA